MSLKLISQISGTSIKDNLILEKFPSLDKINVIYHATRLKSCNGNRKIQLPCGKCLPDAIATILFDVIQAIIHLTPNKSFYTLLKKAATPDSHHRQLCIRLQRFVYMYSSICIWVYQTVLCNFVIKLNFCYCTLRIICKRSASTKFCLQFNGTSWCQSVPPSTWCLQGGGN